MNRSKYNTKSSTAINNRVKTLGKNTLFYIEKFWEFSCFYGDYKASLHAKKK